MLEDHLHYFLMNDWIYHLFVLGQEQQVINHLSPLLWKEVMCWKIQCWNLSVGGVGEIVMRVLQNGDEDDLDDFVVAGLPENELQ